MLIEIPHYPCRPKVKTPSFVSGHKFLTNHTSIDVGFIIWRCLSLPVVHRSKQFLTFERWQLWHQIAPLFMQNLSKTSRRGSRIHTDGFPKRAPKAQASRGIWGACSPEKCFGFYLPKVPFLGFLSHSDRILARVKLGAFFSFKIYLFSIY